MVPQERDLITTLLQRLKSTAGQQKDPEADTLIRQAMVEQPDAPYYLVQTVLIQDLALHNAQNRIADLEQQLSAAQASKPTSFLGGLFGSRSEQPAPTAQSGGPWSRGPQTAPPPPPGPGYAQPGYAPQQGYAPAGGGMMGGGMGGGGVLRSAAATAAAAVVVAPAAAIPAAVILAAAATPPAEPATPYPCLSRRLRPTVGRN